MEESVRVEVESHIRKAGDALRDELRREFRALVYNQARGAARLLEVSLISDGSFRLGALAGVRLMCDLLQVELPTEIKDAIILNPAQTMGDMVRDSEDEDVLRETDRHCSICNASYRSKDRHICQ